MDAFKERLEHMEETLNERFFLLEEEKQVQSSKSKILSLKIANIASIQHTCLMLQQQIASQNSRISLLKSHIHKIEDKHAILFQQIREIGSEIQELEEKEREYDEYYERKGEEMREFKQRVDIFEGISRNEVDELRNCLKVKLEKVEGNDEVLLHKDYEKKIGESETRKMELRGVKEKLEKELASNYKLRSLLQFHLTNRPQ